jgi:hypothetical protein
MEQYFKKLEFLFATPNYSLYIDRETKELSIYNGDDIWTIGLDELGDIGFE